MTAGPWMRWPDGEPCVGSLGVLVDAALGSAVYDVRPPGLHAVTAEISLDMVRPWDWIGGPLTTVSRLLGRDLGGGLAAADVVDEAGAVIAVTTARCQFVPVPASTAGNSRSAPVLLPHPAPPRYRDGTSELDVVDALGARVEPGPETARVVLDDVTDLINNGLTVHGGVLFCGSEMAATALSQATTTRTSNGKNAAGGGPGADEATFSLHMHFLRPAGFQESVTFTARLLHRGRTATVSQVTSTGSTGKPLTIATVTRRRLA